MSLDSMTLYFVATMVAALLGAMLLFFGQQERNPALKWWGTAYLLGAASVALWTLASNTLGEMLSLALNAVGFVACGMVWNASRVFHGRKPNLPGLVLGAIAWVAAVMTLDPHAIATRMTIGAGIVAIYAALTATELWSERRKSLKRRWPAIAVPVLHGFVLMLPIVLGDLLHSNDDKFSSSIWVTAFSIELVLYAVGTVFVIFMLVSERTVSAHKTAASMDPLTGMFNRRGFAEACARVIEREAQAGRPVTVLIFDIDHFKGINDRFGHPAHHRSLGAHRRRGVRCAVAMPAGRGRACRRARARGLCRVRNRKRGGAGRYHRQHRGCWRPGWHGARGAAGGGRYRALSGQAWRPQPRRGRAGIAAVAGKLAAQDRRARRAGAPWAGGRMMSRQS
jgi:GGDEF domain-containing protein